MNQVVARDVARRSFNRKEVILETRSVEPPSPLPPPSFPRLGQVILLTSNVDGLPLAINLMANLAEFGHRHAMILADATSTCSYLVSASPPPCVWSSLLRADASLKQGINRYVSNGVWMMWLQRYLYMLRLMRLGYDALLDWRHWRCPRPNLKYWPGP